MEETYSEETAQPETQVSAGVVTRADLLDENGKFKVGHPKVGGRQVGSISLTTKIKQRLQQLGPQNREVIDQLADNIVQDALDGKDGLNKLVWAYLDGLPKQSTDITSGGKPIPIFGDVSKDHSHQEDKPDEETDTGSSGRNLSQ